MKILATHGFVVVAASALLATVTTAHAGLEETELQSQSFGFALSPGGAVLTFNQFDDMGGTRLLERVSIDLDGGIAAEVSVENDSNINVPEFGVNIAGFMTVSFDALDVAMGFDQNFLTDGSVGATDGAPGTGADFWDFGTVSDADSEGDSRDSDLAAFIGVGTIDANVAAAGGFSVIGSTDSTMIINNFRAAGEVSVTYEYTVVPAPAAAALLAVAGLGGLRRRRR